MNLSILIATVGRRNNRFLNLLDRLLPQVEEYAGDIEVLAYWNNGESSIGEIRQALLEEAKGDYVCFIDDDDMVPDWYCAEILAALGPDYIGFEVQLFNDEVLKLPVFHSIHYGVWHQDEKGYYRGVTHLNPIKRDIALKGQFSTRGASEDEDWARTVTQFVRTEKYINKIMYYYYHNSADTHFGGEVKPRDKGYKRPTIHSPYFHWHPKSKKEYV